jgi:hypothetical protein
MATKHRRNLSMDIFESLMNILCFAQVVFMLLLGMSCTGLHIFSIFVQTLRLFIKS